ncbi:MAG: hypothetical protein LBB75_00545 [Oscillospiraceae bacterium]|jgi:hypothetical protein|nr:hypothetical protein [Oscillospiraceae bacterium]
MKKIICLFLALAALLALMAGCKDVTLGPEEPTTIVVAEDDLANAIDQMNLDPSALDADYQDTIRRLIGQGVTFPADDPPVQTMPPPMPTGVPIRAEDVYPLMEKVRNIFDSGKYTLKARGSTPPSPGMPIGTTPVTFAVDKGQSAFEAEFDWTNMMRAMAQPGSQEYAMAPIAGATMATYFGKTVRFVTKPEGSIILFLDQQTYMQMPAGEGGENGESILGVGNMFGDMFKPDKQGTVTASKVTGNDGIVYLCGEIKGGEGVLLSYYFRPDQNNALKRIEMKMDNPETKKTETFVFEIEQLTETADAAMFSTAGFKPVSVDEMAQMGENGFGSLFGG